RARPAGVGGAGAAGNQVALVVGDRLGNRGRPTASVLAAGERTGLVLRLPEVEHVLAVRVLVVVGDGPDLGPVAAVAIGGFDDPAAGADAPAIAEGDAGAYAGEVVGLLARLELEAGGAGLEAGGARAAGHDPLRRCPRKYPKHENEVVGSAR